MDGEYAKPVLQKHTFHVPNVFSRLEERGNVTYEPLGQEEDGEDVGEGVPLHASGEGNENSGNSEGVEYTTAWEQSPFMAKIYLQAAFVLLGAAVLLPFNAIITPTEYYRSILTGTSQEKSFMSWIILVYNISSIAFGAHATATMPNNSIKRRIFSSMAVIISILVFSTALTAITAQGNKSYSTTFTLPTILLLTLIISAATSYLQLAVITLSNAYGPRCLGLMLTGQGAVGAGVSYTQLVVAYVSVDGRGPSSMGDGEAAKAAVKFFVANSVLMIVALYCYWRLTRSKIYREMEESMANKVNAERSQETSRDGLTAPPASASPIRKYMSSSVEALYDRIMEVQRKTILPCFTIAYIFVVTLAVFPSLTSRVRPEAFQEATKPVSTLIFVAWHFVAFNTSDLIGRTLPTIAPNVFCFQRMGYVSIASLLRTALIPLLALCNLERTSSIGIGDSSNSLGSPAFFFLVIVLGTTNGLLATNTFIIGPRSPDLVDGRQRGLAAGLISWWLTFGLAIGGVASFFIGQA
ncbi:uncharacterized protein FA14DRAFT_161415 [Meira miltonrushii]|uniref:Nucleoside transporter n=1 Tax=Meira miltonrushii TaxID=1280837 RepID=A0A316VBQ1_9BASI|nr:uncharacterized protein FA14DRAFT_161415 [Meira miltonrushii]PWN33683.1 hypothetical protein FA14DRAFT_161415 [Meira miltonrushii]